MEINKATSTVLASNTGRRFTESLKVNRVTGIILARRGFEIADADLVSYTAFITALQNATLAEGRGRIYPLLGLFGATDETAEATELTSGYGMMYGRVDSPSKFKLEYDNYGFQYFRELMGFNTSKDLSVFIVDTNFIAGQKTSTGFAGFDCSYFQEKAKYGDMQNAAKNMGTLVLANDYALGSLIDGMQFPSINYDITKELAGITELTLSAVPTALTITVGVEYTIGKTNVYDEFADELEDAAAWVATVSSTGAVATISAVAKVPATKQWALTVPAGTLDLKLASPAALKALTPVGVGSLTQGGFESNIVSSIVVPAT
jgi:hypothetical protein